MATMVLCLALLCLYNLMPPSESTPDRRSEEVEKYVLNYEAGGARSHLFSQCMKNAATVEGVLYSITVSGDEKYVRFVPKEKMEFQWTIVDLGESKGIIDCALKAFELRAYMFKFEGSCSVSLAYSAYDPKSEQDCDGAAAEVVYISSKYEFVSVGESRGCLYGSPEGVRVGDEKGYHLVIDCSENGTNFCEAQARCNARGLPMASKSFFDELEKFDLSSHYSADVNPVFASSDPIEGWVNIQRINDTWKWMPDMVVIPNSDIQSDTFPVEECAFLKINKVDKKTWIETTICKLLFSCVYCYDPNSLLPQC